LVLSVFFLPAVETPGKDWRAIFTIGFSVIAACAAWVVALVYEYRSQTWIVFLSRKPIVYLGRISYGIYLCTTQSISF
jgi:peptidoglycan/LPS O-acetylase OafA/YrhL